MSNHLPAPTDDAPLTTPVDERIHRRRWATLAVLSLSLVMVIMDNTILNVALPRLARELDAGTSELQWIVDAYTIVFAGLLLTLGAFGDRRGRRMALLAGLAVFAAGSVAGAAVSAAHPINPDTGTIRIGSRSIKRINFINLVSGDRVG
mgnify:CR=1 FL=1